MSNVSRAIAFAAAVAGGAAAFAACSSDDPQTSPTADAGVTPDSGGNPDGGQPEAKGGFVVTVSGEDLAVNGYEWTKDSLADGDPPAFVDGWAIKFDHVIVTVDKIRVNADPDKDEANPTNMGAVVASVDGPFAVDVAIGGDVVGKSGSPDEKTVAVATIEKQSSGAAFDPATRYGFSYDLVGAAANAKLVNLDAAGKALYEEAKTKGWSTIYSGTATYKGPPVEDDAGTNVFAKIPKEVKFKLGFKNPSTYANCRNTDLQKAGDEFPRGVQATANKSTVVQITVHTDHAFWNKLNVEGTPLHFDAIAANSSTYGTPATPGVVTIDDLVNVDVTGFKTKAGEPLPWRSLVKDFTAPAGQMKFDANGTSFTKANSFAAFLAYSAASGGHMNADGECEITNNFTP